MIKIKATLLLIVFISNLLLPLYPFIEYELNKEYIIKVLCINKDKPENSCNGKCHLNKQLKKASENNQDKNDENTVPIQNFKNEIFIITNTKINVQLLGYRVINYCVYEDNYMFLLKKKYFHPPEIA